jgi:hypothetical protein
MATEEEELLSFEEFEAMARHKGLPARVGQVSRLRFTVALLMLLIGAGAILMGVALIYWRAAIILGGVLLAVGSYFVDLSKPER